MVIVLLLFTGGAYFLHHAIWGIGTNNSENYELYIPTGSSYKHVFEKLKKDHILKNPFAFDRLAAQMKYKKEKVKSGRYIIRPNLSNRSIISTLRSGNQEAIEITFNNIRTVEDLSGRLSRQVEADSIDILNEIMDPKNLERNGLQRASAASIFLPNTYQLYWNISSKGLYQRMEKEHQKFWSGRDREGKAEVIGLSKKEVSILASIVEKESNNQSEKPIIAGVYLNRLERGMPLQADPTVIFAIGNFEIKRVLTKHLLLDSPYNTYLNIGLPPGPICLPEIGSIEAVLNAEQHKYLYFCAKPGYDGRHLFATNLIDHNRNARRYQIWLSREGILR